MPERRSSPWLIYIFAGLGALLLIALFGGSMFLRSYNTPAASMEPTVMMGDVFFAQRGYYADHAPMRGEVALFVPAHRNSIFIKRVIGLPGDTVEMREGRLWLNGAEVPREAVTDAPAENAQGAHVYRETLPDGPSHLIYEIDDNSMLDTFGPYTVPPDNYFVMGDNRDNSNDSRVPDFGAVPRANFTDRPLIIYFSRTAGRAGGWIE